MLNCMQIVAEKLLNHVVRTGKIGTFIAVCLTPSAATPENASQITILHSYVPISPHWANLVPDSRSRKEGSGLHYGYAANSRKATEASSENLGEQFIAMSYTPNTSGSPHIKHRYAGSKFRPQGLHSCNPGDASRNTQILHHSYVPTSLHWANLLPDSRSRKEG
ncbi:hypothetical protein BDZ91DRAFT_745615 [Kalaharituber pfeilii]|nr:hypothetical protein BDZ91DRAFT_745615 [Kalaharituber pfeilii]